MLYCNKRYILFHNGKKDNVTISLSDKEFFNYCLRIMKYFNLNNFTLLIEINVLQKANESRTDAHRIRVCKNLTHDQILTEHLLVGQPPAYKLCSLYIFMYHFSISTVLALAVLNILFTYLESLEIRLKI